MVLVGIIILTSVTNDNSFGIILNLPINAFVTVIGADGEELDIELSNFKQQVVSCWIKSEVGILNEGGAVIDTETSKFLKVNPVIPLSVTDAESNTRRPQSFGGFEITPKIKCATELTLLNPQDTFSESIIDLFPREIENEIPLVLESGELIVRIYSSDRVTPSLFHDTFNGKLIIGQKVILESTEFDAGTLTVTADDIERRLENGKYQSLQKITIDGVLTFHFQGDASRFIIPISTTRIELTDMPSDPFHKTNNWSMIENPLLTERLLNIQKDVNLDGFGNCVDGSLVDGQCVDNITGNPICADDQLLIEGVCKSDIDEGDPICKNPNEHVIGGICVPVEQVLNCEARGLVTQGNICVSIGVTDPNNPNPSGTDFISQLTTCLASGDPTCLFSGTFLPLFIGGLGAIILIGAVAQGRGSRPVDIYGVPAQGF